jgi:hypothetical protein
MSKDGIADFPMISNLKHLTFFADHDKPGLDAARECGPPIGKVWRRGGSSIPAKSKDRLERERLSM